MAWEERNGRLYYYAKRREGKRVVSIYMGRGTLAELAEEAVLGVMAKRELEKKEDTEWQELEQLRDQIRNASKELLEAHGLHRPERKPWRRRRTKLGKKQS